MQKNSKFVPPIEARLIRYCVLGGKYEINPPKSFALIMFIINEAKQVKIINFSVTNSFNF